MFNLNSNALRPAGWTSGDAAGLPMFPALPRFDECERGVIEHACRIVVVRTRRQYIYPANHYASSTPATQTNVPAMGQRLRLKSSYVITNSWTKQEKAVLTALKKYGAMVADNGNFFSISVTPDDRWPAGCFDNLTKVGITNFEVIQTTGPNEGPRSPGAPVAYAGPDFAAASGIPVQLQGFVNFSAAPVIQWKLYSGPTNLAFANAALTNTSVIFSAPGVYTLMLSADDGVHAVTYDAVAVAGAQDISVAIAQAGTNVTLSWTGGAPPFVVEGAEVLPADSWSGILTTAVNSATVPFSPSNHFFRIQTQ